MSTRSEKEIVLQSELLPDSLNASLLVHVACMWAWPTSKLAVAALLCNHTAVADDNSILTEVVFAPSALLPFARWEPLIANRNAPNLVFSALVD